MRQWLDALGKRWLMLHAAWREERKPSDGEGTHNTGFTAHRTINRTDSHTLRTWRVVLKFLMDGQEDN